MPKSILKLPETTSIGARLRWLREFKEMTLQEFGGLIGCDPGYLSRLENGKAKNPSLMLLNIVRAICNVQPDWLWLGKGDPFVSAAKDERTRRTLPGWSEKRLQRVFGLLNDLPEALAAETVLAGIYAGLSLEEFQAAWHDVMNKTYPTLPAPARLFWNDVYARVQLLKHDDEFRQKLGLTDAETSSSVAEVKAQLPGLLDRLRKATAETGKKSELADFLKRVTKANVPLASVSRWLSGEREPGGEVTLLLLRWVELQERQTK